MIKFIGLTMLAVVAMVLINESATGDFWQAVDDAGFETVQFVEMLDQN